MTFFRNGYRWSRHPFGNFYDCLYTLFVWFPSKVWQYRDWLANDADFDYSYLSEVMEIKLRAMSRKFTNDPIVVGSEEMAAETLEAAEILSRMGDHVARSNKHGYERYTSMTDEERASMWAAVKANEEADRKRFGELMSKIEWWWD